MVYDGTSDHCGIRKYFVVTYVWMAKKAYLNDQELLDQGFAPLPAEFLLDIAKFYIREESKADWDPSRGSRISVFYDM